MKPARCRSCAPPTSSRRRLLNSISHELRTPLASITGVLSGLRGRDENGGSRLDPRAEDELIQTAWEEAERLNQLVGNLLDMSRLQAGALRMTLVPSDVEDLVGATLNHFDERLAGRPVVADVQPDLPPVPRSISCSSSTPCRTYWTTH